MDSVFKKLDILYPHRKINRIKTYELVRKYYPNDNLNFITGWCFSSFDDCIDKQIKSYIETLNCTLEEAEKFYLRVIFPQLPDGTHRDGIL